MSGFIGSEQVVGPYPNSAEWRGYSQGVPPNAKTNMNRAVYVMGNGYGVRTSEWFPLKRTGGAGEENKTAVEADATEFITTTEHLAFFNNIKLN